MIFNIFSFLSVLDCNFNWDSTAEEPLPVGRCQFVYHYRNYLLSAAAIVSILPLTLTLWHNLSRLISRFCSRSSLIDGAAEIKSKPANKPTSKRPQKTVRRKGEGPGKN